jgi:hypothetical protein
MNIWIINKFNLLLILLITAGFFSLQAQQTVSGKVTDSLQNPLAYANILAIPNSDTADISFAITEDNGNYKK